MSAGDARHGRRDNGLVAAEYAAAGDVDPRVGEHLLDVLALDGIAAYLRPTTDLHPVTRSSTLPGRPTDRLYVDRVHLAAARDYLARLAEEPATADVEDAWAQIVAAFDTEVDAGHRSWPDAEDLPEAPPRPEPTPARAQVTVEPADEPSLLDGLDTFGAGLPDDEEDRYIPPPPPPVPRPSAPTAFAVLGIVVGLVVFLKPDLLPITESVAMLAGFTAVVAGFATLVWRLRPGDDDDDSDPDHGAVV
jgi:hypothetical protein